MNTFIGAIGRVREYLEGRPLRLVFATIAFLAMVDVSPAFAADCDPYTEHKLTVLDWTKDVFGRPDTVKSLRVKSEVCPTNETNGTKLDQFHFGLLGADKFYSTRELLESDLKLLMGAIEARKRFGVEKLSKMAEQFELDTKRVGKTADAKPPAVCPAGQTKMHAGTGDETCRPIDKQK
ncbi:MAG: hypothetical protein NT019_00930 [Candidatus Adlerbacteria bacterium]|nr:hypothetical protein [Candidatus Adlerbacteria bacterium]